MSDILQHFLHFPPYISHLHKGSSILQTSLMKFRKTKSLSSPQSKSVAEYDMNLTYYKVFFFSFFYAPGNFKIKNIAIKPVSKGILKPSRWLIFFSFLLKSTLSISLFIHHTFVQHFKICFVLRIMLDFEENAEET